MNDWNYGIEFDNKSGGYNFQGGEIAAMDGCLNIIGGIQIASGYLGTADTVVISGIKLVPPVGTVFLDTTGTDTLKIKTGSGIISIAP